MATKIHIELNNMIHSDSSHPQRINFIRPPVCTYADMPRCRVPSKGCCCLVACSNSSEKQNLCGLFPFDIIMSGSDSDMDTHCSVPYKLQTPKHLQTPRGKSFSGHPLATAGVGSVQVRRMER